MYKVLAGGFRLWEGLGKAGLAQGRSQRPCSNPGQAVLPRIKDWEGSTGGMGRDLGVSLEVVNRTCWWLGCGVESLVAIQVAG